MGWWTGRTSYNAALSQAPIPCSETQEKICNFLALRGDVESDSLFAHPPTRKESETPSIFTVFYSHIFHFFVLVSMIIITAIICLFMPINTKSISQPAAGVFAPNQQRCSRVLYPFALLFLPLLPWSSRCHFATVAAPQIPDLPQDLTPFPHGAEGGAQQSPPAIRWGKPTCLSLSPIPVQWTASQAENRLQRIVSLCFLGRTGLLVFVFKHNFSLSWGLLSVLFQKDVLISPVCASEYLPRSTCPI